MRECWCNYQQHEWITTPTRAFAGDAHSAAALMDGNRSQLPGDGFFSQCDFGPDRILLSSDRGVLTIPKFRQVRIPARSESLLNCCLCTLRQRSCAVLASRWAIMFRLACRSQSQSLLQMSMVCQDQHLRFLQMLCELIKRLNQRSPGQYFLNSVARNHQPVPVIRLTNGQDTAPSCSTKSTCGSVLLRHGRKNPPERLSVEHQAGRVCAFAIRNLAATAPLRQAHIHTCTHTCMYMCMLTYVHTYSLSVYSVHACILAVQTACQESEKVKSCNQNM